MFIHDAPIEKAEDDKLDRVEFSELLAKGLLSWDKDESLVVALYGDWGSGKTSIVNLTKEYLQKNDTKNSSPIILQFNPWQVSGKKNLTKYFFSELSKSLKHKDTNYKKIADYLDMYSGALSLVPTTKTVSKIIIGITIALGFFGISFSSLINSLKLSNTVISNVFLIFGVVSLSAYFLSQLLSKISYIFRKNAALSEKSLEKIKEAISIELKNTKRKLIIVIDDIDRLYDYEILEVFKLIRINADFPNLIYLLPFDKKAVKDQCRRLIGEQINDYLEKIIQVNFNVPHILNDNIHKILFNQLNIIIEKIPGASDYFSESSSYWGNVFTSGLSNFFVNLRDVKRFINSFKFNIEVVNQKGVLEVNPIDFIAIEAIRVFAEEYYLFLKENKTLFTANASENSNANNIRNEAFKKSLELVPEKVRVSLESLLKRLFPQFKDIIEHGYITHGTEWQIEWSKQLRICSNANFDAYFTLVPGSNGKTLSQYELQLILSKVNNQSDFEEILKTKIYENKIRVVFKDVLKHISDDKFKTKEVQINILTSLFNISDNLPQETEGLLDLGAYSELERLVYFLLKNNDKDQNKDIFSSAIQSCTGITAAILLILREGQLKNPDKALFNSNDVEDFKSILIEKIIDVDLNLLEMPKFDCIIYRWKEWNADSLISFIDKIIQNDDLFLKFLGKFIHWNRTQSIEDSISTKKSKFYYKNLYDFIPEEQVKEKVNTAKENAELYKKYRFEIETYLENVENWTEDPF